MKQLTKSKSIKFSETQFNSLEILESYGVNVSQFIRIAISEKLKRDWKSIKEKKERVKLPFYFNTNIVAAKVKALPIITAIVLRRCILTSFFSNLMSLSLLLIISSFATMIDF